MPAPSNYEKQIIAMFDSFSKTVIRNFSRNLERADENRDKHFSEEPVDYLLDLLSHEDRHPSDDFVLYADELPCVVHSKTLYKALRALPEKKRKVYSLTSGMTSRTRKCKIKELLPAGWEETAKKTGAFTRSRKIKNPEEVLRLNLLYLTNGGAFGKTSAMLKLTQENSLNKNMVYERILKSADWLQWLCQNLCRKERVLAPLPQWLENRSVCLVDASDESKHGSKGADYRLYYLVELFQLSMIEMHLTSEKEGEKISHY